MEEESELMELYLAHELGERHAIREWELGFEKDTGISLLNPFYDSPNRTDIAKIDKMTPEAIKDYLKTRNEAQCNQIVWRDLELIRKSDGMVAFVSKSIGTSMEVIMASLIYLIPVYVISEKYKNHAWIRTLATKTFSTVEEFEEWICHI